MPTGSSFDMPHGTQGFELLTSVAYATSPKRVSSYRGRGRGPVRGARLKHGLKSRRLAGGVPVATTLFLFAMWHSRSPASASIGPRGHKRRRRRGRRAPHPRRVAHGPALENLSLSLSTDYSSVAVLRLFTHKINGNPAERPHRTAALRCAPAAARRYSLTAVSRLERDVRRVSSHVAAAQSTADR